jgi:hypothetical protein
MRRVFERFRGREPTPPPLEDDGKRLMRMLDRTRVEPPEYVLIQGKMVKRIFHPPNHGTS